MSAQYNNQMYPTNNTQFNNNNQQQNQMFNQTYCRPNEFLAVDVINGGEVEANAYCVAPGVTTFLIDFQNNLMFIKSLLYPMRMFSIEELTKQFIANQQPTQSELNLQTQIDELKVLIGNLCNSNNNQQRNNNPKKGGNQQ